MTTTIENTVITAINDHIVKRGGSYASWYVGIAQKPRERLFQDHNVNSETDLWIFKDAFTSDAARRIEKYFIDQLGTDGGSGGGDGNTTYVYAYKKNLHTTP